MRHNDDNHEAELRLHSRDDEANLHDVEGSRSTAELQPIAGRGPFELDLAEPPGAHLLDDRAAE